MNAKTKCKALVVSASIAACSCTIGAARAQEGDEKSSVQSAGPSAIPLQVGIATGYAQGLGGVASTIRDSIAKGGLDVSVSVDHRPTPSLAIGLNLDFLGFGSAERDPNASSLAINLGPTFHFDSTSSGDPWLRLGTGYRLLWVNDPPGWSGVTVLRHGFQVLTLRLGYDVRVFEGVAIGPVIGGDLNALVWEDRSDARNTTLPAADFEAFAFAGVQGRFGTGASGR